VHASAAMLVRKHFDRRALGSVISTTKNQERVGVGFSVPILNEKGSRI